MNRFHIDTETIENGKQLLKCTTSKMIDAEGMLRQLETQMDTESAEFSSYSRWNDICECCGRTIQQLTIIRERMEMLKGISDLAPQGYLDIEQHYKKKIEELTNCIPLLQANLTGIMSDTYPVGLEKTPDLSNISEEIEKSRTSLEMTNLMMVTKILEEEYSYLDIEPQKISEDR